MDDKSETVIEAFNYLCAAVGLLRLRTLELKRHKIVTKVRSQVDFISASALDVPAIQQARGNTIEFDGSADLMGGPTVSWLMEVSWNGGVWRWERRVYRHDEFGQSVVLELADAEATSARELNERLLPSLEELCQAVAWYVREVVTRA